MQPNPYEPPVTVNGAVRPVESQVRYRIIALTAAMSLLLYLDRFCLGPATDTIIRELHLEKKQFGWAVGLFFVTYALFQVPAGWLCERFGSRRFLMLYVVAWSLITITLGWAYSLWAFLILRLLLGVAQAGAYPAAAGYIKKWIPLAGRARANSMVTMSGRTGGLLAFLLTSGLMSLVGILLGVGDGKWRIVFAIYGSLGLIWAMAFWLMFRETPREHPGCSLAEIELLERDFSRPPVVQHSLPILSLLVNVLTSANVWLLSVAGFFINVGWVFLVSWLTTYLGEKYGDQLAAAFGYAADEKSVQEAVKAVAGPLTALTGLAGVCGSVVGGVFADRMLMACGPVWGRRIPGMISGGLAMLVYILCMWVGNVWVFLSLMCAIYFLVDFGLGALWATYQDIGGRNAGSVLGFANMCGNLGAAAFAVKIGYLADSKDWPWVFYISSFSFAMVATCWMFVNPSIMVFAAETEAPAMPRSGAPQ